MIRERLPPGLGQEATLRYQDGEFRVLRPGAFVRCAVTGEAIPLEDLRYWSVARQEPYKDYRAVALREAAEAAKADMLAARRIPDDAAR